MGAKKKNPSSNATKERKVAPVMEEADIEETIDYVATADRMIRMASSPGDPDDQDDEDFDDADDGENDDHDDEVDGEDDEDEDAEDDEDEDEDVDAKMGAHDNNEEEDDDDDDESVEEVEEVDDSDNDEDMLDDDAEIKRSLVNNDISIPGDEPCTFDLRNLLGASAYPVDSTALYIKASAKDPAASDDDVTIPRPYAVNEAYLLTKAVAGCNQIVSALWQLPVERTDAGPMVQLPTFDESKIPRALAPPAQKAETKWEKFAKAKGIGQNKEKRSAKVFDEATGEWQYRHGFKKAGSESKEWPIMEVKSGEDPFQDPWEMQRNAKRARVDKNVEARMRNAERGGELSKGTSNRMLKSISASRKAGKEGGQMGVNMPIGVPVDLKSSGRKGNSDLVAAVVPANSDTINGKADKSRQRGKASTMAALRATQISTASLGKFDKMREGEPERKKTLATSARKRKFEGATDKKVIASETERSLKVLKSLGSGSATKEKDRKKGNLATGETAYDYDFNDGLGASTFRKKKGRAGSGKMKKMTKKRVK